MGKCKNCKLRRKYVGPHGIPSGYGSCAILMYVSNCAFPQDSNLIHLVFEQTLGDIFIGSNFGCIHFKKRGK